MEATKKHQTILQIQIMRYGHISLGHNNVSTYMKFEKLCYSYFQMYIKFVGHWIKQLVHVHW